MRTASAKRKKVSLVSGSALPPQAPRTLTTGLNPSGNTIQPKSHKPSMSGSIKPATASGKQRRRHNLNDLLTSTLFERDSSKPVAGTQYI